MGEKYISTDCLVYYTLLDTFQLQSNHEEIQSINNQSYGNENYTFIDQELKTPYINLNISDNVSNVEEENNENLLVNNDLELAKWYLLGVIQPIICCFGIIGNLLNIVVLSRKRFSLSMDGGMEMAALAGMLALAVSDMTYCISALPEAFLGHQNVVFKGRNFFLIYKMYGKGIQSILSFTSTWLTVLLATARYIAICHPLQARIVLDLRATLVATAIIVVCCVIISIPSFWRLTAQRIGCPGEELQLYVVNQGLLETTQSLKHTMTYIWFIVCFLIPVAILTYCNIHLIKALRESLRMRAQYRSTAHAQPHNCNSITPTLIAVIIVFIILVAPAKILSFFYYIMDQNHIEIFMFALILANVMMTLNFSINFLLYCAVNKKFRASIKGMCDCKRKQASSSTMLNGKSSFSFTRMSFMPTGRIKGGDKQGNSELQDKSMLTGTRIKSEIATFV